MKIVNKDDVIYCPQCKTTFLITEPSDRQFIPLYNMFQCECPVCKTPQLILNDFLRQNMPVDIDNKEEKSNEPT